MILIDQTGLVAASGAITRRDDGMFVCDGTLYPPDVTLIDAAPPGPGLWRYVEGVFYPVSAAAPPVDREAAKAARALAVDNIKVTTSAGNTFDGDETSQARMSRAILVLSAGIAPSVPWVLADNTVIQATAAELTEAMALAGAEQARLWVLQS